MTGLISLATASSPRVAMNARIAAAATAGTISTADQNALSAALDNIDKSLSSSSGAKTGDIKSKINSLIDDQVSAGTLTEDQGKELAAFFAAGKGRADPTSTPTQSTSSDDGSIQGAQEMGGSRGPGGSPPPPPQADDDDDSSSMSNTSSTTDTKLAALEKMIENLRKSLQADGLYGASGVSGGTGRLVSSIA